MLKVIAEKLPELSVRAAEKKNLDLTFDQGDKAATPIDLTGATLYFTAKADLADADADAIFDETVTTHTDAENGETSVLLDLTGEPDSTFEKGRTLFAEFVLKDSQGQITSEAFYHLKIEPAVRRSIS